jgi:hypothetical protein
MRQSDPSGYFAIFEGTYSKDRPINRKPAAGQPPTSARGRIAIALTLLVLGAGTAAAALTASRHANVAGHGGSQSATFISLPGVVDFEDALY